MSWNFSVYRLNGDGTETRIATDVVLNNVNITYALSAHNVLTANLTPEIPSLLDRDGQHIFVPWSSAIYAEKDGVIRFGGIVTQVEPDDETLGLVAEGFVAYANQMPYEGDTEYIEEDPIKIAKDIWEHLQSQEGGNLGLTVLGDPSPVRIGTEPREVEFTTGDGEQVSFEAGPYKLTWYGTHDLGKNFNDLAEQCPFDYDEYHAWDGDDISHTLTMHYPARTTRRNDLRFAIGENVRVVPNVTQDGDDYASSVLVLGAGEGRDMRRGEAVTTPKRLRRTKVITDKSLTSHRAAIRVANSELPYREDPLGDIAQLEIIDHPNAQLFGFAPGDQIRVIGDTGWAGVIDLWCKVISISVDIETDTASLSVVPV